jgi:hypothetical protein
MAPVADGGRRPEATALTTSSYFSQLATWFRLVKVRLTTRA